MTIYVLFLIFSYVLGSIPNALWIGKIFKNMDVREYGSGNLGSTNVARVLGYRYGILTLILDVLKGIVPVYLVTLYYQDNDILHVLVAMSCILGHSYSMFVKFQGGKSVATSLGVLIIISPKSVLFLLGLFFIIVLITGYVSVASMSVASILPINVYIFNNKNITYMLFSLFISILVVYRHKSNIVNLLNGKESKFTDKINKDE